MRGMKYLFLIAAFSLVFLNACQAPGERDTTAYTTANAHSHNDYEQQRPFEMAYGEGFGSIEADVFLWDGELFVAHDREDIRPDRTLKKLYLEPLAATGGDRPLQLLIDLKTGAGSTLPVLISQLAEYPLIAGTGAEAGTGNETGVTNEADATVPDKPLIRVVVSGNRPDPKVWAEAPSFIYFDGRPDEHYSDAALQRTGLISDSFRNYSDWDGRQPLDSVSRRTLAEIVDQAHRLGKPFRFWAVPDTPEAWELMTRLGVDYINTDQIGALSDWLKGR